jgi:hypothetical protein
LIVSAFDPSGLLLHSGNATGGTTAAVGFPGADPDPWNKTATALVTGLPSALSKRNLLGSAF